MSEENDMFDYDDDAAVAYIRPRLPQEIQNKYTNNEIIYIGDIIYDFYEKKGSSTNRKKMPLSWT